MFALVDNNNFYASCEQLFDPQLRGRPVVVLSSNDGCIIARSQEARDGGIPMGVAAYQIRKDLDRIGTVEKSANFCLYGDMSHRVTETLANLGYPFEIYSIDESFVDLTGVKDLEVTGNLIHSQILRWTGIASTVGIGSTKTRAKVANKWAKKHKMPCAVFTLDMLNHLSIEDVWGIGKALANFFRRAGIYTAANLLKADATWVKKNLSVMALKTLWELQGKSCLLLDETVSAKKAIISSRTFRRALTTKPPLAEAIAHFTAIAAEKMRKQKCVAGFLTVKIATNKHRGDYIKRFGHMTIPTPTAHTPKLIAYAQKILDEIYLPDLSYKRGAVMLADFSKGDVQSDFFAKESADHPELTTLVDRVNKKYGKNSLFYAAEGIERGWRPRGEHRSPKYTTQWSEIPHARVE